MENDFVVDRVGSREGQVVSWACRPTSWPPRAEWKWLILRNVRATKVGFLAFELRAYAIFVGFPGSRLTKPA